MTDYRQQFEREMALASARKASGRDPPHVDAKAGQPHRTGQGLTGGERPAFRRGWFKVFLRRVRRPFGTAEHPVPQVTVDAVLSYVVAPVVIVVTVVWRVAAALGRVVNDKVPGVSTVTRVSYPWIHRMARLLRWVWNHGGGWIGIRLYHWACCDKVDGKYTGTPLAVVNTACFAVFMWLAYLFLLPPLALAGGGVYYYGTWASWDKIYVPNSGVHQSQNFVQPNAAGLVISARDEIYTVLGKHISHDVIEEIRFDIDYNFFFGFYEDSLRPDLAASKLSSQTPFGVICDLETTGIYSRLPRFIRISLVKWSDLRPEIVRVKRCEQLQTMPDVFLKPADYPAPLQ